MGNFVNNLFMRKLNCFSRKSLNCMSLNEIGCRISGVVIFALLTTAYFLLSTSCLSAAPHINGKNMGPKEYVHRSAVSPGGVKGAPIFRSIDTTGTRKIAVILVNFATAGSGTSGENMMISSDITSFNNTFNYLKSFYNEVSYGKLNLEITFYTATGSTGTLSGTETPYLLTTSMSSYGEDTNTSLPQLIIDAINKTGNAVKHTSVAGGTYDGVMVAHAGYGNESTVPGGDIWSANIGPFSKTNGFTEGTIIPAREGGGASPIGVTCHELGHHIGLWDLYATDSTGGRTQVGDWSLMDDGAWSGNPAGSQPSHPSAWEKEKIGWLDFIEVSSGTNKLTSYAFETSSSTAFRVKMQGSETEYFVVCFTSKTAKSPANPGTGLLIWHIDEGVINGVTFQTRLDENSLNNYTHRTVCLEEADAKLDANNIYQGNIGLPTNKPNFGEATDAWPGTLVTFTIPYSNKYSLPGVVVGDEGDPSMVTVTEITNTPDSSNFTVYFKPFVSGYVTNGAGEGLKDVALAAVDSSGTLLDTASTDFKGKFIFTDLDDGAYTLTPSKTGWHFFPPETVVSISTYSIQNVNFRGVIDATFESIDRKPNSIMPVNNLFTPGTDVTTVYYKTARDGRIKINLYTLDGRLVKTLVDETMSAGLHNVQWDGLNDSDTAVASGIYLINISAPGYKETKKICVIR